MEKTNVTIIFAKIRTSKSTYYLLYDKSHSKTQYNYNSIFNIFENFSFTNEKIGKIGGFSLKIGENRNILKKIEKKLEMDTLL